MTMSSTQPPISNSALTTIATTRQQEMPTPAGTMRADAPAATLKAADIAADKECACAT
jgi:hypothetical protein